MGIKDRKGRCRGLCCVLQDERETAAIDHPCLVSIKLDIHWTGHCPCVHSQSAAVCCCCCLCCAVYFCSRNPSRRRVGTLRTWVAQYWRCNCRRKKDLTITMHAATCFYRDDFVSDGQISGSLGCFQK